MSDHAQPIVGGGDQPSAFSISNYVPPGPVARSFIVGSQLVRFLMGPVGGGKTTSALFACLAYTARMPPCTDGVIRAKGVIVRTDYRTLYKTTLPSWFQWFPRDFPGGKFTGGADRPATHELNFSTGKGRKIELTVEFQALGDKRIEDILRGWEGSWALMEEADLLEREAMTFLLQRTSRFPPRRLLPPETVIKPCVLGSLNPPSTPDHWVVKAFLEEHRPDMMLFQQPSGLSPDAENLKNLPPGYYERIAANAPEWEVQRFVHGKIGWDRSGMPVYPDFDQRIHLSRQPLAPVPNEPIFIGLDCSGLHPAAIVVQRGRDLRLRVLEEVYEGRAGPTRFTDILMARLETTFRNNPIGAGYYDPTNDFGADKEAGDQSWIDVLRRALKCPLHAAPTNEPAIRIDAVRNLLLMPHGVNGRMITVNQSGCKMLVEGFLARYRYKLKTDGTVVNADKPRPEKNEHSNVHDALQYACLGLLGRAGVISSAAKGMRPGVMTTAGKFVVRPFKV